VRDGRAQVRSHLLERALCSGHHAAHPPGLLARPGAGRQRRSTRGGQQGQHARGDKQLHQREPAPSSHRLSLRQQGDELHAPLCGCVGPDHFDPHLVEAVGVGLLGVPGARAVVVLRFQEDLEPREIAQILGLPVSTVKSRLQRALIVLRGKLASSRGVAS